VLILGCGLAYPVRGAALHKAPVEVTVLDRTNHHLFTPLLYQVATAALSAPSIAGPTLLERGCFTWKEWTEHLSAEIAQARERGEVDDGSRYYEYWLAALEKLAAEKGLATLAEVLARREEWDRAARSTPHGKPIVLPGR
jgi:nitrile hydratase accessory protein